MAPPAAVQLDLIARLEHDGVISPSAATLARERYVTSSDPAARSAALFTMSNCAKASGVLALLMALLAFIGLITPWLARAPIEVYQAPMLAAAAAAALRPRAIWPAQAQYVALLATLSGIIVTAWILYSHNGITAWLDAREHAGWPVSSLLASATMTVAAAAAILHHSPALAVAAAVFMTTALIAFSSDGSLPRVVTGHLLAVATHLTAKARGSHPTLTYLFTYAAEYYCTVVLGAALWIGTFAWDRLWPAVLYTALFAVLLAAAAAVYYHLSIKTPASILTCFAALVMLTWLQYLTESGGAVAVFLACGAALFGFGLLLERHRRWIVFEMPQDPHNGGAAALQGSHSAAAAGMPILGEGPQDVAAAANQLQEC